MINLRFLAGNLDVKLFLCSLPSELYVKWPLFNLFRQQRCPAEFQSPQTWFIETDRGLIRSRAAEKRVVVPTQHLSTTTYKKNPTFLINLEMSRGPTGS